VLGNSTRSRSRKLMVPTPWISRLLGQFSVRPANVYERASGLAEDQSRAPAQAPAADAGDGLRHRRAHLNSNARGNRLLEQTSQVRPNLNGSLPRTNPSDWLRIWILKQANSASLNAEALHCIQRNVIAHLIGKYKNRSFLMAISAALAIGTTALQSRCRGPRSRKAVC